VSIGDGGGSKDTLANLSSLTRYERAWLRGDVVAGVTVAAYQVPQVLHLIHPTSGRG
jgi:SulP family sulfate permease